MCHNTNVAEGGILQHFKHLAEVFGIRLFARHVTSLGFGSGATMKPESPFYEHCRGVLEKSILFSDLDEPTLQTMLGIYRRETWDKGAHLPPKLASELFSVIISGRMELTRTNPETGRQITLFTLAPGDVFDVITLLDGREHDIQPIALETLELITAPLGKVRQWIETHPAFNRAFLPYLGEKIRDLENLSADLALYETVKRLALLILQQATPDPALNGQNHTRPPLINTLSDEAMARMIGSVRVIVNRHLQDFIRMGLISTSRGQLVVHDLEKLREYCEQVLAK
jgi:CRP/FNR family transcriptional regulator, cyclic AMP receptor protein